MINANGSAMSAAPIDRNDCNALRGVFVAVLASVALAACGGSDTEAEPAAQSIAETTPTTEPPAAPTTTTTTEAATTTVTPGSRTRSVVSAKDLKPLRLRLFKNTADSTYFARWAAKLDPRRDFPT